MNHTWLMGGLLVLTCHLPAAGQVQQAPAAGMAVNQPAALSATAFMAAAESGRYQLVDVRTPAEHAAGHLAGSTLIDWTSPDYEQAFARLDAKRPVLLYCHSGGRSEQALEHLAQRGYQVQHLDGGIVAWRKAGFPVVKD